MLEAVHSGEHLTDCPERDIADTAEAVVDARRLLADDRHLVLAQQIVGFVDAPGRGVLNGQHGKIHLAGLQRIHSGLIAASDDQLTFDVARCEIFLRREVSKRMLTANGHAQGNFALHTGAAGHLPADRLGEEVTIDPPDEIDRRALGPRDVFHGSEDLAFAIGVPDRGVGGCLLAGDVANDAETLRDQLDDSLIEVAESLAKRKEFGIRLRHARSLRSTGKCRRCPPRVARSGAIGKCTDEVELGTPGAPKVQHPV